MLGDGLGEFARDTGSGRYECEINTLEVIVVLEEFHSVFLATEFIGVTRTAFRSEEQKLVNREVLFVKDPEKLLTYGATDANNCYFHALEDCMKK
ncbi:hypothetical protein IMSAGC021_00550 [Muribaculaceae bacterium]|nr:hypothetical protein IMSAGC021_00550 [Muribaculaceae bacterium]